MLSGELGHCKRMQLFARYCKHLQASPAWHGVYNRYGVVLQLKLATAGGSWGCPVLLQEDLVAVDDNVVKR